jgi:undecaprenyl-diphosphatase
VSFLEAIVLGIVQGLTEFLPISSTAHLRIVPAFAGWPDPGAAFTAVVQLGTMAAVVLYFRRDLFNIARSWLASVFARGSTARLRPESRHAARLGWYIVLGTIPIGAFGVLFKDEIETGARNLYLIGAASIVVGLVLLWSERVGRRERDIAAINARDGVAIGVAQAFALVPGVSRSGSTIAAGLFRGLDRPSAARYSFLLSVPAVVLSGLFELRSVIGEPADRGGGLAGVVLATLFAFIVGYASIAFLLRFLVTHSTKVFVAYRVALGTLVIVLAASHVIS